MTRRRRKQTRQVIFILAAILSIYLVWWFIKSPSSNTSSKESYKEINLVMFGHDLQQQQQPKGKQIHDFHLTKCEKLYGKILILQFVTGSKYAHTTVRNALQTVRCYATLRGYDLLQVIWNNGKDVHIRNTTDIRINLEPVFRQCRQYSDRIMVLRHCVTRRLLVNYDYVIQIDADTGIVNPKRCFEEFIEPGIDIHLQLSFDTGEIQAPQVMNFLKIGLKKRPGFLIRCFCLTLSLNNFYQKAPQISAQNLKSSLIGDSLNALCLR